MGWSLRKRIKVLPGVHLNVSKRGVSGSVGVPGSGVSYTTGKAGAPAQGGSGCAPLVLVFVFTLIGVPIAVVVLAVAYAVGSRSLAKESADATSTIDATKALSKPATAAPPPTAAEAPAIGCSGCRCRDGLCGCCARGCCSGHGGVAR